MAFSSINPTTGEKSRDFEELSDAELDERLDLAAAAFREHRRRPIAERAAAMARAADILDAEKESLARTMTLEMGKPFAAAVAEVEKCALGCRFYAEHGEHFLADEEVETDASRSFIRYEPLGAVLAVMPWNFPLWQVFRFAAPALVAGNVGLLKHASNVPRCALAIEDVLSRAGFERGVFQTLLIGSDRVERVLDHPAVRAATLTGSTGAGSAVAAAAGKRIKKTVLELGGSDPFIVMPSADLAEAAKTAVRARTINNGQSCIAAKRFIIHHAVYEQFEERFVDGMKALNVGDPMDPGTDIGPLATPEIRDEVHEQVMRTVAAGGRLLAGGEPIAGRGNFYPPTVIADVPEDSPAYRDEIFGPVAALFMVDDAEHAARLANDTDFGLGSAVWTRDRDEQAFFIREIEAGQVFINGMVASDPRLPFGGVKTSGYGRELGIHGIREFVNAKTIWIGGNTEAAE
jgi:succinate-semialdehyde dehydrogenase/glutarate-semialdehyde dehydrogenase